MLFDINNALLPQATRNTDVRVATRNRFLLSRFGRLESRKDRPGSLHVPAGLSRGISFAPSMPQKSTIHRGPRECGAPYITEATIQPCALRN